MSYTVVAEDWQGELLASAVVSPELHIALPQINEIEYPVMRFLDEYDVTTLNSLQVDQLIVELEQLRERITDPAAVQSLDELFVVVGVAQRDHNKLTFLGD